MSKVIKKKKIKIIHIIDGFNAGGVEVLSLNLIKYSPNYTKNYLINIDDTKQEIFKRFEILLEQGKLYSLIQSSVRSNLSLTIYIMKKTKTIKPKFLMIYPCNIKAVWIAIGAKLSGVENIYVHIGNTAPFKKIARLKWLILFNIFGLLNIKGIPCSKAIVESIKNISPKNFLTRFVHNGCDSIEIFNRANIARKNRPLNDNKRIIMVARFDQIKDHYTLIKAFARSRLPGWKLCLVGTGQSMIEMKHLVSKEGIEKHCEFLGSRTDIPELLGKSDIFAFSTTNYEGFGIALIEAISAGIAVIASDVNACREVLQEGRIGELITQGNILDWSNILYELMNNKEKLQFLKAKATKNYYVYDIRRSSNDFYNLLFSTKTNYNL